MSRSVETGRQHSKIASTRDIDAKSGVCGGCWFLANVLALITVPLLLEAAVIAGGSKWSLQSWALLFGGGAALALMAVLIAAACRLERGR